jgi:hypothetical protein
MNKINFKIGQSNELICGSMVLDLHNHYDYAGCLLKSNRFLCLLFDPNGIHGEKQVPLAIEFEGIDFLEFSPNFGAQEQIDLAEIGYKNPLDLDDNWLLREDQAVTADHMFFRFTSNAFIRVHSEQARIRQRTDLRREDDN